VPFCSACIRKVTMYIAELKGKLSLTDERKEDILTSNVFSFFKYSTRKVFLKDKGLRDALKNLS
jgi:hypothetical protein